MTTVMRPELIVGSEIPVPARQRLDPGAADTVTLNRLLRQGIRSGNESFDADTHLRNVVPKPWGYEYRAYVDDFFDLWVLHVDPGHGTSMHAHPRKLTYLICLAGTGITIGLGRTEHRLGPGSVVRIGGGAFHCTRNDGDDPLVLIEVEVPRNKYDLVRLADDYQRAGTEYESESVTGRFDHLRRVPHRPNSEMRDRTADGRFRFRLRTGMDVFYRRLAEDMFYIPLCVSGVVRADVDIIGRDEGRAPQTDVDYLCISRTA
jgi:mannose-6-phosphate isomerase-like protein (cupin superfamily)